MTRNLLNVVSACSMLAFAGSALAQATPATKPAEPSKAAQPVKAPAKTAGATGVKVGDMAPGFNLMDTNGKEHTLASNAGKIVVIEWFNPDCPYVKKHHVVNKTFADLSKKFGAQGVVFFAVNSNAAGTQGSGQERNAKAVKDYGIEYPVLLDDTGATGLAYGAKKTPTMFVIGADGKVAFKGGIDDDDSDKTPGKTNFVAKALEELLAKKPVTTTEAPAYGCAVKYKN